MALKRALGVRSAIFARTATLLMHPGDLAARTLDPDLRHRRTWRENLEAGPRLPGEMPSVPPTRGPAYAGAPARLPPGRPRRAAARQALDPGLRPPGLRPAHLQDGPAPPRAPPTPCPTGSSWTRRARLGPVRRLGAPPADPAQISSSVCFGMPSMPPGYWRKGHRSGREALGPGQALAVSVAGTPGRDRLPGVPGRGLRTLRPLAAEARRPGRATSPAPSVCTSEGSVYQDPRASRAVAQAIRAAIGARPLLLKAGVWRSPAGWSPSWRRWRGSPTEW